MLGPNLSSGQGNNLFSLNPWNAKTEIRQSFTRIGFEPTLFEFKATAMTTRPCSWHFSFQEWHVRIKLELKIR